MFYAAPLSAYEAVLELLQSGFNPGELPMLWSKLRQVVVWTINDAIEGYKIPLPDGTAGKAFAIAGRSSHWNLRVGIH